MHKKIINIFHVFKWNVCLHLFDYSFVFLFILIIFILIYIFSFVKFSFVNFFFCFQMYNSSESKNVVKISAPVCKLTHVMVQIRFQVQTGLTRAFKLRNRWIHRQIHVCSHGGLSICSGRHGVAPLNFPSRGCYSLPHPTLCLGGWSNCWCLSKKKIKKLIGVISNLIMFSKEASPNLWAEITSRYPLNLTCKKYIYVNKGTLKKTCLQVYFRISMSN